MASVITVGGLATGLNSDDIITKLLQLERQPIVLLQNEFARADANKSAVASLSSRLSAVKNAASALNTVGKVLVRKAATSDAAVVVAAAGEGADRGSVGLNVTQLARNSVAGSTIGAASATATVAAGAGTFAFQVGSGPAQTVTLGATTTLQDLAGAITDLSAGVTASVVNLGTASTPDYRLALSTSTTGSSSTLTVLHDDTTLGVQTSQAGQNARFSVSGFSGTFERETNTVTDVLNGVTLSLKSEGAATVTVDDDAAAITAKVQALVASFNDAVTFVQQASEITQTQAGNDVRLGSLAADSSARRVVEQLHSTFSSALAGATGGFVNLSSLGLATQRDGTIGFNQTKFSAALASDATGLAQVFAGNGVGAGIANDLATFADRATQSGGMLDIRSHAIDQTERSIQDQIDVRQRQVDKVAVELKAQFAALESFVNNLKTQGNFLSSVLGR